MRSISEVLYISEISSFVQFVRGAFALTAFSNTVVRGVARRICCVPGSTGVSRTVLKERVKP